MYILAKQSYEKRNPHKSSRRSTTISGDRHNVYVGYFERSKMYNRRHMKEGLFFAIDIPPPV